MINKTINLDGLCPILLERSIKAKRLSISINPLRLVRVTIPKHIPFNIAENFVKDKYSWIKKNLRKMKDIIIINNLDNDFDVVDAKLYLIKRINFLSNKYGFSYRKLYIKNQKTRWGSCTIKNNINLNINLVSLPEELSDYVIMHELVHTKIKNHGTEFWKMLNKYVDNARLIDKKLKNFHLIKTKIQ